MKSNVYDHQRAARLIPLLRSITREIRERTEAIDLGESKLNAASIQGTTSDQQPESVADLQARLACNRRELRLAKQELSRLGCSLDQNHPLRILIPGSDGNLRGGYAWTDADEQLQSSSAES